MLRLEQEEVPQRKESKKDSDKADEAEADIKLESQDSTMKRRREEKVAQAKNRGLGNPRHALCVLLSSPPGELLPNTW